MLGAGKNLTQRLQRLSRSPSSGYPCLSTSQVGQAHGWKEPDQWLISRTSLHWHPGAGLPNADSINSLQPSAKWSLTTAGLWFYPKGENKMHTAFSQSALQKKKKGDLGNFDASMLKINQRAEKGKKGLLLSKSCQAASQSCSFTAFTSLIFYCWLDLNITMKKNKEVLKNLFIFSFYILTLKVVGNINEWIK